MRVLTTSKSLRSGQPITIFAQFRQFARSEKMPSDLQYSLAERCMLYHEMAMLHRDGAVNICAQSQVLN